MAVSCFLMPYPAEGNIWLTASGVRSRVPYQDSARPAYSWVKESVVSARNRLILQGQIQVMTIFAEQIGAVLDPVTGIGDTVEGPAGPPQAACLIANAAHELPSGFPAFARTHPQVLLETDAAERTGFDVDSTHPGVTSALLPHGPVVDPSSADLPGLPS